MIYYTSELSHHGVKGMRWGVRRYQNPDGTLTPAGKKRISKDYKKLAVETSTHLAKNHSRLYVDAYNKAADYMNKGGIDRFNDQQRKKYGENYTKRDGYEDDYQKAFDEIFAKNWNKTLNDFYSSDKTVQKGRAMVKQYNMTKWDDLAKQNEEAMAEVRQIVEQYDD